MLSSFFHINDDSLSAFIESLYPLMQTNTSFIDFKFNNVDIRTHALYKKLKKEETKAKNEECRQRQLQKEDHLIDTVQLHIRPDWLTSVDFHEYEFESIRYLQVYQHSIVDHQGHPSGCQCRGVARLIDQGSISFSLYYRLKKEKQIK